MITVGTIEKTYPTKTFDGKRGPINIKEIVVREKLNSFDNYLLIQGMGDMAELMNNFRTGDQVEVAYNVVGRKGTGKYEGRFFVSLNATDVSLVIPKYTPEEEAPDTMYDVPEQIDEEDMPF